MEVLTEERPMLLGYVQINIHCPDDGTDFQINVEDNLKVQSLKELIRDRFGHVVDNQRLSCLNHWGEMVNDEPFNNERVILKNDCRLIDYAFLYYAHLQLEVVPAAASVTAENEPVANVAEANVAETNVAEAIVGTANVAEANVAAANVAKENVDKKKPKRKHDQEKENVDNSDGKKQKTESSKPKEGIDSDDVEFLYSVKSYDRAGGPVDAPKDFFTPRQPKLENTALSENAHSATQIKTEPSQAAKPERGTPESTPEPDLTPGEQQAPTFPVFPVAFSIRKDLHIQLITHEMHHACDEVNSASRLLRQVLDEKKSATDRVRTIEADLVILRNSHEEALTQQRYAADAATQASDLMMEALGTMNHKSERMQTAMGRRV